MKHNNPKPLNLNANEPIITKSGDFENSLVFSPTTFTELIKLYNKNPQSLLSDGSPLSKKSNKFFQTIIFTDFIEEWKKCSQTDRYFEFGASVKLAHILSLDASNIPSLFTQSIKEFAPMPILDSISLGKTLTLEKQSSIEPILKLLEGRIEVRNLNHNISLRWIDLKNNPIRIISLLSPHDIITRVRIPKIPFNFHYRKRINFDNSTKGFISLSAVSLNEKYTIIRNNFIFTLGEETILKDNEMEAYIINRVFPLSEKERDQLEKATALLFGHHPFYAQIGGNLFKNYLRKLTDTMIYAD